MLNDIIASHETESLHAVCGVCSPCLERKRMHSLTHRLVKANKFYIHNELSSVVPEEVLDLYSGVLEEVKERYGSEQGFQSGHLGR